MLFCQFLKACFVFIRAYVYTYNCPPDPDTSGCSVKTTTGCYKKTVLPFQAAVGSYDMTKEFCATLCFANGFTASSDIAGVKAGRDCYCGNSLISGAEPAGEVYDCTIEACSGDQSQDCGSTPRSPLLLIVYSSSQP